MEQATMWEMAEICIILEINFLSHTFFCGNHVLTHISPAPPSASAADETKGEELRLITSRMALLILSLTIQTFKVNLLRN